METWELLLALLVGVALLGTGYFLGEHHEKNRRSDDVKWWRLQAAHWRGEYDRLINKDDTKPQLRIRADNSNFTANVRDIEERARRINRGQHDGN